MKLFWSFRIVFVVSGFRFFHFACFGGFVCLFWWFRFACFGGFVCFGRFVSLVSVVSVVAVVLFRSFRFVVSGFSTCRCFTPWSTKYSNTFI